MGYQFSLGRYEKAALGDPRTAKHRKVSICAGPLQLGETLSDRIDDLLMAVMWVKQELILLRQHDILLKRQFFNIHDSIQALQPKKRPITSSTSLEDSPSTTIMNRDDRNHSSSVDVDSPTSSQPPIDTQTASTINLPNNYTDYHLETFLIRPSASVTVLNSQNNGDSNDSEDDDAFFENKYYRPRTSSMRTSRDLAALARRRGSKELI